MMDQSRLEWLMEQYFNKRCSEAERQELLERINDAREDETIKAWMDGSWNRISEKYQLSNTQSEQIFASILGRESAPVVQLEPKKEVYKLRKYSWRAAAAVLIILLGAGGYLFFSNKSNKPAQNIAGSTILPHDAAPGRNAAILTIAGGKQILLDSMASGTIPQQGNTTIINTKGQLAYKESGEKPATILYNTLTTQRGNQYQLVLPDGSKVWLNAASSITYPTAFTGRERMVTITGEAYFEVIHNAKMPFKVKAGNEIIEDLGTHFNINAYADEPAVKTTLLEGEVKVGKLLLKPGEQASTNARGQTSFMRDVDMEDVVAWKNGKFHYRSVDMESIMRQAARWYDMEVEYRGKINETFSGGISRNVNASELLKILEYSKKVSFEIEGRKIIVKPITNQ